MRRLLISVLLFGILMSGVAGGGPSRSLGSSHEPFDHFNADATGRDYTNAYLLALLSYYVYDGIIPGATGAAFEQGFEDFFTPLGLTNFSHVDILGTQAAIAETDDAVIVTFRGTQQIEDFLTDALLIPTVPEGIHTGFRIWSLVALPGVLAAIEDAGDKKVWLTGHSLGAALAQVIAYDLAAANILDADAPDVQGIVTFGSPRVFTLGSPAGLIYSDAYGEDRSQRWANNLDPVPHLVPAPAYIHQSEWTLIDVANDDTCSVESLDIHVVGVPDLEDHDANRYATRIFYLMPIEERVGLPLPPLPSHKADCDLEANVPPTALIDEDVGTNSVAEGASNGTSVGITASATDVNEDDLSYSLTDDAGGRFAINSNTGEVSVADGTLLDFESDSSHTITAEASDGSESTSADFTISVSNVAPSIPTDSDGAANSVNEGAANGTYVGVTAASSDPNGPPVSYSLTDDAGGRFAIDSSSGVVSVADGSLLDGPDSHNVTVAASDGLLPSSSNEWTISVLNVSPTVTSITPSRSSIDEGDSVTVLGTFTDPGPDTFTGTATWSDGVLTPLYIVGKSFSTFRNFPDDHPTTGTSFDLFTVEVKISDDDSESDSDTSSAVTVANLDPVVSIDTLDGGLPDVGLVGVPVVFGGNFSDVGILDTHTAALDWGDGSLAFDFGGGNVISPLATQHTYTAGGEVTVSLTVTDDDGGQTLAQATVTVLDGAGAAQAVSEDIETLLAGGGSPAVLDNLAAAFEELAGNDGGTETNGAIDKLDSGDLVAALVKIGNAIDFLEAAEAAGGPDTSNLRLLLALAARSAAQVAYDDAVQASGPSPSKGTQKQLDKAAGKLADGISELGASDYGAAVDDFRNSVRWSVPLLP